MRLNFQKCILTEFFLCLVMTSSLAFAEELESEHYDQNLKEAHLKFKNQAVAENTLSGHFMVPKISPYQLFAGTVIPGVLVNGMNSDLPGNIIGQVSQNIYSSVDGKYLLIPQGTKIIGVYDTSTAFAQSRGAVIWQRLIFPNGDSIVLPNFVGSDSQGYAGLKDKVRSHYSRVVWSALLGGVAIGGMNAAGSRENQSEFAEDAAAQANSNMSSVVDKIVDKNLNIAPTIIIRPGYKFNIMVEKDLLLKPYIEE